MPRNRLEVLAERWVPGTGAVEVRTLPAGVVNETCRVTRDGHVYSLRVAAADGRDWGLDRLWECAVRRRAEAGGLAPPLCVCEPADGILVADWVAGRTWSSAEARLPENVDVMARLLRRVHALDIPEPARRMDPAAWIAHYRAALAVDATLRAAGSTRAHHVPWRSADLARASAAHLAKLELLPASQAVLCHSDLHRLNLLIGARPVLLDWEYAHVSDGFWDLAGWVANNDWTPFEAGRLLLGYLGRPPRPAELTRLASWVWLYDYVCLLWSELCSSRRPGGILETEIAARAAILRARLARNAGVTAGGC